MKWGAARRRTVGLLVFHGNFRQAREENSMNANIFESQTPGSRFRMPTLSEIFWGPLANRLRRPAQGRKDGPPRDAHPAPRRRAVRLEAPEPRVLLSADLMHAAAAGVALDALLRGNEVDGGSTLQLID